MPASDQSLLFGIERTGETAQFITQISSLADGYNRLARSVRTVNEASSSSEKILVSASKRATTAANEYSRAVLLQARSTVSLARANDVASQRMRETTRETKRAQRATKEAANASRKSNPEWMKASEIFKEVKGSLGLVSGAAKEGGSKIQVITLALKTGAKAAKLFADAVRLAADAARAAGEAAAVGAQDLDRVNVSSRLQAAGLVSSIEELKGATRGTVSASDLRQLSLFAEQMRFSSEETKGLLQIAEALSLQTGEDLTQSFRSVTEEIAGLTAGTEFERLGGDVEEVERQMDEFAKSIGKAGGSALNDQEKRTFLFQAALERAQRANAAFGERASDDIRSLQAAWADFTGSIERDVASAAGSAARLIDEPAKELSRLFDVGDINKREAAAKKAQEAEAARLLQLDKLREKIRATDRTTEQLEEGAKQLKTIGGLEEERAKLQERQRLLAFDLVSAISERRKVAAGLIREESDANEKRLKQIDLEVENARFMAKENLGLLKQEKDLLTVVDNKLDAEQTAAVVLGQRLSDRRKLIEQEIALFDARVKSQGPVFGVRKAMQDIRKRSLEIEQATLQTAKNWEEFVALDKEGAFTVRALRPLIRDFGKEIEAAQKQIDEAQKQAEEKEAREAKKRADKAAKEQERRAEQMREARKRLIEEADLLTKTERQIADERLAENLALAGRNAQAIEAAQKIHRFEATRLAVADWKRLSEIQVAAFERSFRDAVEGRDLTGTFASLALRLQGAVGDAIEFATAVDKRVLTFESFGISFDFEIPSEKLADALGAIGFDVSREEGQGLIDSIAGALDEEKEARRIEAMRTFASELSAVRSEVESFKGAFTGEDANEIGAGLLQMFEGTSGVVQVFAENWEQLKAAADAGAAGIPGALSITANALAVGAKVGIKNQIALAAVLGGIEVAKSASAFAEAFVTGPIGIAKGIAHSVAAAKYFAIAGGGAGRPSAGPGSASAGAGAARTAADTARADTTSGRGEREPGFDRRFQRQSGPMYFITVNQLDGRHAGESVVNSLQQLSKDNRGHAIPSNMLGEQTRGRGY